MKFLADPSLPGHGDVTGLFFNRDRSVAAVASAFRLLTEPPARASYAGHRLRYRLALYRPPNTVPFAVCDALRFPVNHVAFHPFETTVAVGTGSYDGGYLFEGELVVWNWHADVHSNKIGPIPEVVHCAFSDDGTQITALVRPWDEGEVEHLDDPFEYFFEISAEYPGTVFEGVFDGATIARQISDQEPIRAKEVAFVSGFSPPGENSEVSLMDAFQLTDFESRSPIWDVAWLDRDRVGIVHDACHLEVLGTDGKREKIFTGPGHGVQIFTHPNVLVHVVAYDETRESWFDPPTTHLQRYQGDDLKPVATFEGRFTFSVSRDGWILGRRNRSADRKSRVWDVIGSPGLDSWKHHDLGHYDVFNHFLRVDGAPYLFAIQGTPPQSHERKLVCNIATDGSVTTLWPILPETNDHASHAMECAFAYIADTRGEGLVVSGNHYTPNPSAPEAGFIYRKPIEGGKELWRHATKANATSILVVPEQEILLVAFLNGEVAALESGTGKILQWTAFRAGGQPSVVFSLDATATDIVFGTVDGRVAILPLRAFLDTGFD